MQVWINDVTSQYNPCIWLKNYSVGIQNVCNCTCVMYVCMYVCMKVCICVCICMHVCMHACMYVCMYVRYVWKVCMCVCMCVFIYAFVYTHLYIYIYIYICIYVYICVCVFVCVSVSVCVCVCVCVCMYACMYARLYVCHVMSCHMGSWYYPHCPAGMALECVAVCMYVPVGRNQVRRGLHIVRIKSVACNGSSEDLVLIRLAICKMRGIASFRCKLDLPCTYSV